MIVPAVRRKSACRQPSRSRRSIFAYITPVLRCAVLATSLRRRQTVIQRLRSLGLSMLMMCGMLVCAAGRAAAYPLLQEDIGGGTYNSTIHEIVAGVNSDPTAPGKFTLYVYLYNPTAAQLEYTYFVSAALTPKIYPPGGNFG